MQHPVQQWLNSPTRNYAEGVQLYAIYGKYKSVLALLQTTGETDITTRKLADSLLQTWEQLKPALQQRIAAAAPYIQPATKVKATKPDEELPQTAQLLRQTDAVATKLNNHWKPLYAEMGAMHARLSTCSTNDQRYAMACRILDIEQQLITIWQQLDTYIKTGKKPAAPRRKRINSAALSTNQHRLLMNLRTYVSRMELSVLPTLIKKQATAPTKRRARRITENEAQLATWKQQLKDLENGG